jgi:hypothetical protein
MSERRHSNGKSRAKLFQKHLDQMTYLFTYCSGKKTGLHIEVYRQNALVDYIVLIGIL